MNRKHKLNVSCRIWIHLGPSYMSTTASFIFFFCTLLSIKPVVMRLLLILFENPRDKTKKRKEKEKDVRTEKDRSRYDGLAFLLPSFNFFKLPKVR
jgi:hypothetical protein